MAEVPVIVPAVEVKPAVVLYDASGRPLTRAVGFRGR